MVDEILYIVMDIKKDLRDLNADGNEECDSGERMYLIRCGIKDAIRKLEEIHADLMDQIGQ
jgi:hypothetical protein